MYTEIFELHSGLLKAMAHPKRLEIVQLLRHGELSVGQIQEMLDLPQANLSQHLIILREEDIVVTTKKGKQVFYSLSHINFGLATDLLREVLIQKYKKTRLADELSMNMMDMVPVSTDPVCGMRVSPRTASYGVTYKDSKVYFCAGGCMEKFNKNPDEYIKLKVSDKQNE
jgi:ArsR family transcriptional regulator, virulence genes transcriptional regulator